LGLRFSGKNMSPLPCWLAGTQSVALNLCSGNDLAVQLHFALFNHSLGFVLKPPEMCVGVSKEPDPPSPRWDSSGDASSRRSEEQSKGRSFSGTKSLFARQKMRSGPSGDGPPTLGRTVSMDEASGASRPRKESFTLPQMRRSATMNTQAMLAPLGKSGAREDPKSARDESFWPPPRETLHLTTIRVLSLHSCPKRGEKRPKYDTSRGLSHSYHRELSGLYAPPNKQTASSPMIAFSLHPVGGFCGVGKTLPLPHSVETEITTKVVEGNGLNAAFVEETIHCLACEPRATFLRVGVVDETQEVAYEVAVLGRLRRGYRVFQMRGLLGTRIELCFLFVHITFGTEPHLWVTSRALRVTNNQRREQIIQLEQQLMSERERHQEEGLERQNGNARLSREVLKLRQQLEATQQTQGVQ